ncbi:DUF4314 domain-containing protein [Micromonospora sp. U21]|uniref:DUF4314 domain-containing protein n=1 Tax=Micromonospora sp. U21 TaxID=2824899 RepID=UPI001B37A276|nr:DUF4314 domain-containing protein [Micromonospora sp. U21]MBQ0905472.1 DUF4314 domain-containing protein [Micromonospora sp. U21]
MTYQPDERIALEHTNDPHTLLRPGDEGTVRGYDPDQRIVTVDWDSGSRLAMVLDAGDRIRRTGHVAPPDTAWQQALDALRAAGATAGNEAAQWWAQDVIGGRAHGNVAATARRILGALDDGDPEVLDGLPAADRYAQAHDRDRYAEAAPDGAPTWIELTGGRRDETRWAWCDGFDQGVTDEVARQCRILLSPTGDDRDLSHLHPKQVRIGGPGVFAGDWSWTPNDDGEMRIPVGFIGTLVATWNGWAVFTCTRQVAEAIVADQHAARDRYRQHLADQGVTGSDLDDLVDESRARMCFDGDVIDVDESRVHSDPEAVQRIAPNADGEYIVMGWAWTWIPVHPYDCDRLAGDIPDSGEQRQAAPTAHDPATSHDDPQPRSEHAHARRP